MHADIVAGAFTTVSTGKTSRSSAILATVSIYRQSRFCRVKYYRLVGDVQDVPKKVRPFVRSLLVAHWNSRCLLLERLPVRPSVHLFVTLVSHV